MLQGIRRFARHLGRSFPPLTSSQWTVLRVQLGFGLLLFAQWPDPRGLEGVPASLLAPPPGLPQLLTADVFRTEWFLLFLQVSGTAAVVAFIAGARWSVTLLTGWAVLSHSILFSYGKIDHTYLPWLLPLALATSGWGRKLGGKWAFSPSLAPAAILVSIAWLTAALPKVRGGWLELSTQAVQGFLLTSSKTGPTSGLLLDLPQPILEAVDWAVVCLELALAFAVLGTIRWRSVAVLGAIAFHLSALAVFGIGGDGLAVAYAALLAPFALSGRAVPSRPALLTIVGFAALWRMWSPADRFQFWLFGFTPDPDLFAAAAVYLTLTVAVLWPLTRKRWGEKGDAAAAFHLEQG